jgi:coenzyme A diphosphatase NUDT7
MSLFAKELNRLKAQGMERKDLSVHEDLPRASVLVPLFRNKDDELHVLLTQRPLHLKSHPGEVCFPGGRQDPEDEGDDVVTALREAHEEVGLERSCVAPLCRLSTVESKNGLCVTPIVGWLDPPEVVTQLEASEAEVAAVFTVPLEFFRNDDNLADKFDVPWSGGIFTVRTFMYSDDNHSAARDEPFKIWGLTAHILHQVSCIAADAVVVAPKAAPATNGVVRMKGHLWAWSGKYWSKDFYVLGDGVLHQYASEEQADRKSTSATKKNRLPLADVKTKRIEEEGPAEESKFVFEIDVLGGRIQWRVAAASDELRDRWINALTF